MTMKEFSEEQKQYLQGFAAGAGLARQAQSLAFLPVLNPQPPGQGQTLTVGGGRDLLVQAQDRFLSQGKKLTPEEKAKRDKDPLQLWDEHAQRAEKNEFPKGTDVFLTKFEGLFFVSPAQNSYMCRLRLPAGVINAHQLSSVADLAESHGGGYAHVTTRANLQIREIPASQGMEVLTGLRDLGIINRGAGADNIRNITCSPTAGIDPGEWIDTRPLAKRIHHYILNHPEMYCLPRKFNIAIDGGGEVSTVADTNDIGFFAVRVNETDATPEFPHGVYFRMELGGITGHKDFSRDTGVLLQEGQCLAAAAAVLRVFIDFGDRTDRKKARLKYLLDEWGFEKYLAEGQKHLLFPWPKFPEEKCQRPRQANPLGHVDFHPQKQPGLAYVGVVLPVGKLTCEQMRQLARIAQTHGTGDIRLTVWQNLLLTGIPLGKVNIVKEEIEKTGLHWSATRIRAGLVACTGSQGCKFAASDTKGHAELIANHLEAALEMDQPVNIHLTGCHHSCAQHYIGDIGLLGTKVAEGDDQVEGYHIYIGGGHGENRAIGKELLHDVTVRETPAALEALLRVYLEQRLSPEQKFHQFVASLPIEELRQRVQKHRAELAHSLEVAP